jgi:signal peptidase II
VLGFDQLTKYYISTNYSLYQPSDFIKGLVNIVYIHNPGAAWGIFSGKTWLLVCFTLIAIVFCGFCFVKYGKNNKLLLLGLVLVVSGGIGNLIDRVFRGGKVIDFLHFEFWPDFPVFNVADCSIVIGVGILLLYFVIDTVNDIKMKRAQKGNENADN